MRFPELGRAGSTALALAAATAFAAPESIRHESTARLRAQLPDVAPADYALGAAAFDAELRARVQENADAGAAAVEAGRTLWTAKFKDGRSLASCFPNGGRRIAGNYPLYHPRLQRVVPPGPAGQQCRQNPRHTLYHPPEPRTLGAGEVYPPAPLTPQRLTGR